MIKTLLILFLFPVVVMGQTKPKTGNIWLCNSRGETVGSSNPVITRHFFDAEWVDIRSDFMTDSATNWCFVIRADQFTSAVFTFKTCEFPDNVIKKIKLVSDSATIMLFLQPVPEEWDLKKNRLDFKLL
jgi:hypothetical protein